MSRSSHDAKNPVSFGDRLAAAVQAKKSVTVVGLDPVFDKMPPAFIPDDLTNGKEITAALIRFCGGIIEAVAEFVPAVKPNIAFYEAWGINGLLAYDSICAFARAEGLLVIGDVKRGDIGSTAAAYAQGLLTTGGDVSAADAVRYPEKPSMLRLGPHDALTLNPYLGSDSLTPFLDQGLPTGQGMFMLVKTSNPSSAELQDLPLASGDTVAEAVARKVDEWGRSSIGESGLSSVGAVVGATHPDELARYRELMPHAPFLIPGYGAQGGTAADIVGGLRADGSGALVNASRSIMYAWQTEGKPENWQNATRRAVQQMNNDLAAVVGR